MSFTIAPLRVAWPALSTLTQGPVPLLEIKTSATDSPVLKAIHINSEVDESSTGCALGFGKHSTAGVITDKRSGLVTDRERPYNLGIGTNWTVMPVAPVAYFRRFVCNTGNPMANILMPVEIKLAPSASYGLWATSSTGMAVNLRLTTFIVHLEFE
jgi:hypothetical protein